MESTLIKQQKIEDKIDFYSGTLDNPNIILNPYGNSPLTALITFRTNELVNVEVVIKGKNEDSNIYYRESVKSCIHIIPIYGLYPNYENTIILETPSKSKEVKIKTDEITTDILSTYSIDKSNELTLLSVDKGIIGIDKNNDIRYFLEGGYTKDILIDKDNNLILSSNRLDNLGNHMGIVKINLLGKIICEYNLKDGYSGLIDKINKTKIVLLSDNIIEYDIQTGFVSKEFDLSKFNDNWYDLIYNDNEIILVGTQYDLYFDYDTNKLVKIVSTNDVDAEFSTMLVDLPKIQSKITLKDNIYTYTDNQGQIMSAEKIYDIQRLTLNDLVYYELKDGINISNYNETPQTKKYISTLFYENNDTNAKFYKEYDRLVVEADFNTSDEVYIILDKLFDKRIYKFDSNKNVYYLNSYGLNGEYSIYLKVNNKVMKVDKYINF